MGAACTRIEIIQTPIRITNGRYETIWKQIAPSIHNAIERKKIRTLLQSYLNKQPCNDRYLALRIHNTCWVFEILTNNMSHGYTEIVLAKK